MHGACCSCVAGVDCIGCQDAAVCYEAGVALVALGHSGTTLSHTTLSHTHNSVSYSFCGHHCVTHTTMSLMTCSQNSVTVTFPYNSVAHNWCYACIVLCNQYRSFSLTPFCYRSVSDLLLPSSCLPILIFPIYSVLVGKKWHVGLFGSLILSKFFGLASHFANVSWRGRII